MKKEFIDKALIDQDGLTVKEMIQILQKCPQDAKVVLNHEIPVLDNGVQTSTAWIFDTIKQVTCEEIEDKERFKEYKQGDLLVWIAIR